MSWDKHSSGIVVFGFLWLSSLAVASSSDNDVVDPDACPLWLAPSHTGTAKEPKYGLYAGRAYRENETLPNPELAIPLVDMIEDFNRDTPARDVIIEFLESNLWTAEYAGSNWEGNLSAPLAIPGIGVLPNYHTGVFNVDFLQASVLLRDNQYQTTEGETYVTAQPGKAHLSRGALTTYHNVTLRATQPIPAGMELFANFGDIWDGNYTNDFYQDTFHRYDYEDADKIIDALLDLYQDFPDLSLDLKEDILDFFLDKVLGTAAGKHAKTIKSLIPENPRKLKKVKEAGGSFLYRYPDIIRSTEWLQKNGFCLDTIKSGPSTIPNAGRGAFATRNLKNGETITISPMLHIADKDLMTMYPITTFTDQRTGAVQPIGKQLILNYCFGHAESSLLLFPLGSLVTLINHSSKSPNAYITWSKRKDKISNQHEYHDYSVEKLAQVDNVVLVMKVVAMREIAEGEEILLNYGRDWEASWQDYQTKWEKDHESSLKHPLKAEDVRSFYKNRPFETAHTLQRNPYPPNMATACFLRTRERPDGQPMVDAATSYAITEWIGPETLEDYQGKRLFIVDVLDRHEAPGGFFYNYTLNARITATHFEQVVNVPHTACTFVNRPYSGDIHTEGAFRHPISIIDR